jgi:hypothetical protein
MDVYQFLGAGYPSAVMLYVRQRALFSLAAFDALVGWPACKSCYNPDRTLSKMYVHMKRFITCWRMIKCKVFRFKSF